MAIFIPIVNCGLCAGDSPACWDGVPFNSEEECAEWIENNMENFSMNELSGCVCPMEF